MKKVSCIAIIAMVMACPAFADIAANNNNPTCDSNTIGATSGDTALDATWTANTLNLKFMANGQQFASNTCTYGQNITIPTGTPTRTGYNFAGWQLSTNAGGNSNQCNINDTDTWGNPTRYVGKTSSSCFTFDTFGGEYSDDCSNSIFSDLNTNQWKTEYADGVIHGNALCSTTNGTYATTGTPDETGGGSHCWCKITSMSVNGGESCSINSSWVRAGSDDYGQECTDTDRCALNCATYMEDNNFKTIIKNSIQ